MLACELPDGPVASFREVVRGDVGRIGEDVSKLLGRDGATGSGRKAVSGRGGEAALAKCGEFKRSSYVLPREFREVGDDLVGGHSTSEVLEQVVHGDAGTDEARLPSSHPRAYIDQIREAHVSEAIPRLRSATRIVASADVAGAVTVRGAITEREMVTPRVDGAWS